jgi:hypothetical protein
VQIDPTPEHSAQFVLQGEEGQPRDVPRLELDQDVDVAVGSKVVTRLGASDLLDAQWCSTGWLQGRSHAASDRWLPIGLHAKSKPTQPRGAFAGDMLAFMK